MFDVIVVGAGTMGSAAAWAMSRRGLRVLTLEQFGVPHGFGSHHGHSRMFRMSYHEHPDYVPLLRRAFDLWQELERETGEKLFHVTGAVYIGSPEGELVRGALESARRHGLAHEELGPRALRDRFPQFQASDTCVAIFESCAGFLLPEPAVAAMAHRAAQLGAEIHGHEPVQGWDADESEVRVRTAKREYRARSLVLAAGAWSGRVAREIGVPLRVTRQVLGWFWPRRPATFELGRFPCWAFENDDATVHYGFPMLPSRPGLKIARHRMGETFDPDIPTREPREGDEDDLRGALCARLPEGEGPLVSLAVCLYTNSPDGHFILDRHPRHRNVVVACGFSGHGFKFAPALGEVLADLASGKEPVLPAGFLSLARFRGGA
jgi:sarcosine oxidase